MFFTVNDGNLPRAGKVYKNQGAVSLKLKRFGMRPELNLRNLAAFIVNLSQGSTSIANEGLLAAGIVAKIVGIVAEVDPFEHGIGCAIEDPHAPILPICDVEPVLSRNV